MKAVVLTLCLALSACATVPTAAPEPVPSDVQAAPAAATAVPMLKWLGRLLMRLAGNTQITVKVETPSEK